MAYTTHSTIDGNYTGFVIGDRVCPTCGSWNCPGHIDLTQLPAQVIVGGLYPEIDYEKLADMVAERILKELKEVKE